MTAHRHGRRLAALAALALWVGAGCDAGEGAAPGDTWQAADVPDAQGSELAPLDAPVRLEEGALSGTWARAEWLEARAVFPALGETLTHTRTLQLVHLAHAGAAVEVQGEVCEVTMDNASGLVEIFPAPAFVAALPFLSRAVRIEAQGGGLTWREPRVWDVRGADLADPSGDALPERADDPRVVDLDADGNPGATVRVTGILDGEIYVAQRMWTELTGAITGPDRIQGPLAWGEEQRVLGADNPILEDFHVENVPVDGAFVMLRMEGASCDDVRARRAELFGDR